MKAFSVVSPWGEMITSGKKSLEIRSWQPESLPMRNVALVQNDVRLVKEGQEDSNGFVIAIIDIVGSKPWIKKECNIAGCDESEFENGYLAWELANVRRLAEPVNVVAKRKFYALSIHETKEVMHSAET